ncbi:DEAD/DEAH box helicase family protein [Mycolicibacter arupensis]|uniref:Helicase n=1 Tax=Mycolicibacter arupensis TaxID=342002 RepID=A0A5C7XSV4_9MYCO|nr:DEAD/DEAH box helicase family protein [Mycolicibacter arupensis]TXI52500.1 MAG: helicase [Mycolicibacter arupensis]
MGEQPAAAAAVPAAFLTPTDFPASIDTLVPSGAKARTRANIAAVELLARLHEAGRPASADEQRILAAWSGWGAVPEVFDPRNGTFQSEREHLRTLLTDEQYRHAEASVLNAHYTDPAIVAAIWKTLQRAGFSGGRVLEPGCGSGTFIGHAPDNAVMVGVENDPITAAVAAALYPSAQIRAEGFEATRVPESSFASVVGNVPFGRYAITDPSHNPHRFAIHNHFICKALALTAPGGYVAVLTSRYTLDAAKPDARRIMHSYADLIGAIRLPSKAFSRVAGTDVVTDLLILRRREANQHPPQELPSWVTTTEALPSTDEPQPDISINSHYIDNPNNVLGTMRAGRGLHGAPNLTVDGETGTVLAEQVERRLTAIIDAAVQHGYALTATPESLTVVSPETFDPGLITAADRGPETPLYTLRYNPETKSIEYWSGHTWEPNRTAKSRIGETRELIALRDAATSLITSQRDGRPVAERDQLRGHLNTLYDNYARRHGPINRFTWVHPKEVTQDDHDQKVIDAETRWREKEGQPGRPYTGPVPDELAEKWDRAAWETRASFKRRTHLDGGMRHDPGWAVVAALEIFDDNTGTALKAPIFSTDLLTAAQQSLTADTPEDALAMSLDRDMRVDLDYIAALLEIPAADARELLTGLVYPSLTDPDELIPAAIALSGNVREKHAQAALAAEHDPAYEPYAEALRDLIPPDRNAEQIKVRPGAPWIDSRYVAQFAEETFKCDDVTAEHIGGRWTVDIAKYKRHSSLMIETWGLDRDRCDAVSLLEAVCNSRSIVCNTDEGQLDVQATFAAQAKCDKITEEFQKWVFADPDRTETLVAEYNRRFNSLRAPRYDGSKLRLPGLSDHFTPHSYQRDAVARIIAEPATLLDHVVGAGKTGTMLMAAIELRRLGLVRQPWIVVPNHIIEQVGREAAQWYPAAKVLLGSSATTADGRRRFIAQTAVNDWDLVIIPQSAFTEIGVNPNTRTEYIEEHLSQLRTQLQSAESDRTKKSIERAIKQTQERLERLTSQVGKDQGLHFENSGCDYLFVDEAHMFKNKARICNIEELNCTKDSKRAEDLTLKLRILRQRRRDEALAAGIPADRVTERVATFATGTPIANSLGELWVMQSYLRPDLLEAAGVADLGDWGAAFTATVTTVEVNPSGTRLRPVTKVGKFTNLPELLALSAAYSDVVTRDQVPVTLPELNTGQRRIVTLQPDIEVTDFIADLGYRADHLDSKRPDRDNILKISNDGRNVSLDPRLAHLSKPTHSRAAAVADEIMAIHAAKADQVYLNHDTGQPLARSGPLQLVFCDRGTPSADPTQFTIYKAIKDELVARGMPAADIRFIHDARKPAELKALFAACNNGEVSVLIGSTEKMGTGMNVQARTAGLHHVDVPWRPADLEQREGRIRRQGNQNQVVDIVTYVSEGTYDVVMWQKVQAKALFIEQMRRNEVLDVEIEDLSGGDIGSAAAETKAIATGDPRYIRQVELDDEITKLSALQRAHNDAIRQRDWRVGLLERAIPKQHEALARIAPHVERAQQHAATETSPAVAVDGRVSSDRATTATSVAAACRQAYHNGKEHGATRYEPTGITVNGVDVLASRSLMHDMLLLRLAIPSRTTEIKSDELVATQASGEPGAAKARGLHRRVENLYTMLPTHQASLQRGLDGDQAQLDDMLANPPQPFEHSDALDAKKAELAALTLQLRLDAESPEAKQKAQDAADRLTMRGREPGWTLLRNATPAVLEETGCATADVLRRMITARERMAIADYYRDLDDGTPGLDHEL